MNLRWNGVYTSNKIKTETSRLVLAKLPLSDGECTQYTCPPPCCPGICRQWPPSIPAWLLVSPSNAHILTIINQINQFLKIIRSLHQNTVCSTSHFLLKTYRYRQNIKIMCLGVIKQVGLLCILFVSTCFVQDGTLK